MKLSQGKVRKIVRAGSEQRPAGAEAQPASPVLKFDFPMPLNIANSRLHWRVKHNAKEAYFGTLDLLLAAKHFPPPPPTPWGHARIASLMLLGNRMDHDNAMARHKWPLDWLQSRGYIANDKHLDWPRLPQQEITRRPGAQLIVIHLTETP